MTKNSTTNLILSFALGGLVGAGLALLYAPYSGEKTRRKIMGAVEDAAESVSDYADKLKAKIS